MSIKTGSPLVNVWKYWFIDDVDGVPYSHPGVSMQFEELAKLLKHKDKINKLLNVSGMEECHHEDLLERHMCENCNRD